MSDEMVQKKAHQLFSAEELLQAMSLLNDFGTQPREKEEARVRLAMLKLSGGKLDELRACLQMAHIDPRDVLAGAEYPNAMQCDSWKLPAKERKKLAQQDRQEYLDWLENEN